jgi:hypothetical protein
VFAGGGEATGAVDINTSPPLRRSSSSEGIIVPVPPPPPPPPPSLVRWPPPPDALKRHPVLPSSIFLDKNSRGTGKSQSKRAAASRARHAATGGSLRQDRFAHTTMTKHACVPPVQPLRCRLQAPEPRPLECSCCVILASITTVCIVSSSHRCRGSCRRWGRCWGRRQRWTGSRSRGGRSQLGHQQLPLHPS